MRPLPTKVGFPLAYAMLGLALMLLAGFSVLLFAGRIGTSQSDPSIEEPAKACASPACAEIGDLVSFQVSGRVNQISEPTPGWRCIQYQSRTEGAQKCAKK